MQQVAQATGPAPFGRMYLAYFGTYLACIIALVAIVLLFDIDLPSSLGVVVPGIAALIPGYMFVRRMHRRMTRGERAKFALGAAIIALAIISLLLLAGMAAADLEMSLQGFATFIGLEGEMPVGILAAFIVITMAVSFIMIYFFVNMMGRSAMTVLEKQASDTPDKIA
ncbi:MAG: ABZJ_00895 family protein [Salaquimonas sp.]|nr:ABZJ_00895 family protein [Salaquimonas sp.]